MATDHRQGPRLRWNRPAALLLAGLVAPAACTANSPLPESRTPLSLDALPVLYDDNVEDSFVVSEAQWREIEAYFDDVENAADERRAMAQSVARLEQIAGTQTPIHRDGRKNTGSGPGKTDCLDESQNTTTFLRLLREKRLLRHHRVMNRALRSPLQLDIHWTAVVQDLHTGEKWAIDSWYNANGIDPIVQPLKDWLKKKWVPGYYAEDAGEAPPA